jgi:hypothetical protein
MLNRLRKLNLLMKTTFIQKRNLARSVTFPLKRERRLRTCGLGAAFPIIESGREAIAQRGLASIEMREICGTVRWKGTQLKEAKNGWAGPVFRHWVAIWGPRRDGFFSDAVSARLEAIRSQIASQDDATHATAFSLTVGHLGPIIN